MCFILQFYCVVKSFGRVVPQHGSMPNSTTFPIVMRWFLIQIAYNIGNVVQADKGVRTNGDVLYRRHGSMPWSLLWGTKEHTTHHPATHWEPCVLYSTVLLCIIFIFI